MFVLALLVMLVAATSVAAAGSTTVNVTMSDFKFKLSKATIKPGVVVFKLTNVGAAVHDLKIAGKKSAFFKAGEAGMLRVTIKKPGRYPFLCTVPFHAQFGMKGILVVKK